MELLHTEFGRERQAFQERGIFRHVVGRRPDGVGFLDDWMPRTGENDGICRFPGIAA